MSIQDNPSDYTLSYKLGVNFDYVLVARDVANEGYFCIKSAIT